MFSMLSRMVVVLGGCGLVVAGPTAAANERVRCVADGPFATQVHESQVTQQNGRARLSARFDATGTMSCSNGLIGAPVQVEQSLTLGETGTGSDCFGTASDDNKAGKVRGRTDLTLAITAPDGDVRRLSLHGIAGGAIEIDDHDPSACRLDLDLRAHAANGAYLSMHLEAVLDRTTGTLVSGLMSQSELDTW